MTMQFEPAGCRRTGRAFAAMTAFAALLIAAALPVLATKPARAAESETAPNPSDVDFEWGVKIPLRDGVRLQATLYKPRRLDHPSPCVFTLTPYTAQSYHDRGMYFAAHGYPFLIVDVRGRGNSEGRFQPFLQEAHDGYDVVEWLAKQPYCNGKVAMWGGSYAGYDQWATAKEMPPHLATIVPAAAAHAGTDFPFRNNIFFTYDVQWLMFVNGKALQPMPFGDEAFWQHRFLDALERGRPFKELGTMLTGDAAATFAEWVAHPQPDEYWDRHNPTAAEYARLTLPILTITGSYDDDQPGALAYYRLHLQNAPPGATARHYLIIGPWDHAGTRTPSAQVGGLTFGPASLVDLPKLHLDWYAWTMQQGPRPEFLAKPVAYYVIGADRWRYADSLAAVTAESRRFNLDSNSNATDVLAAGSLQAGPGSGAPDHFVHDPRDPAMARAELEADPQSLTTQRVVYDRRGQELVYHTAPFDRDTEVSGFFKLSAWIGIDRPDADFDVRIYEITADGGSIVLSTDSMRARYRQGLRNPALVDGNAPLAYDFDHFTFMSRLVRKGSRLRLVIAPLDSVYSEKNYNAGGVVAEETLAAARPVTVTLFHDRKHPSALFVPIGQP